MGKGYYLKHMASGLYKPGVDNTDWDNVKKVCMEHVIERNAVEDKRTEMSEFKIDEQVKMMAIDALMYSPNPTPPIN